jgi:hypothetical protein
MSPRLSGIWVRRFARTEGVDSRDSDAAGQCYKGQPLPLAPYQHLDAK